MNKHQIIFLSLIFSSWLLMVFCHSEKEKGDKRSPFLNINDSVKYVGMQSCRKCHENVYQMFIKTGMGQSFDSASTHKSSGKFDTYAIVFDTINNFYYKPFWKNDSFFIAEFRLIGRDTVYKRIEQVKYIIGSGQHTNSHLLELNGYIYQCPITFYTQQGKWDMAPGFEKGKSSRFNRNIGLECITCHNGLPEFVQGSENKYLTIKNGIDCERCHGPGAIHVKDKLAGKIVDTSKYTDFTIVNPANLTIDLQMNLCQRCHLQGISVINEGKTFSDFRPGMKISDVFNVFLPRYSNAEDKFIMASQADRLRKSKCFINSINERAGKSGISCITCHNPHISVKVTPVEQYNNACKNCHSRQDNCTELIELRIKNNDNCSGCHMSKSESIDIAHVKITDHFIRKPDTAKVKKYIAQFTGLACVTTNNPTNLLMARGYLNYFESFASTQQEQLDSAEKYLNIISTDTSLEYFKTILHFYYLKNDFSKIVLLADKIDFNKINDGWTYYRMGEAFFQNSKYADALHFFNKATDLKPYNLDFQNKLGAVLMAMGEIKKAKEVFEFIIKENPKHVIANSNLGYIEVNLRNFKNAEKYYDIAIALDPDYEMAKLNKAGLYLIRKQNMEAKKILEEILKKNPANEKVKNILSKIS